MSAPRSPKLPSPIPLGVRLPSLGGARPYNPPVVPVQPAASPPMPGAVQAGNDYESDVKDLTLANNGGAETVLSLFVTKRRWRALDVYLEVPTPSDLIFPAVGIFTNVRGSRTLVRTGRFDATGPTLQRVAALRAPAEKFEVALSAIVNPAGGTIARAYYVATDEAVEQDDDPIVGAVALGTSGLITTSTGILIPPGTFGWELVGVEAAASVAARFFQVHDAATVVATDAAAPIHSFGLPLVGSSVFDFSPALRAHRYTRGIVLRTSSTVGTTTAAVGVSWNAWAR